MRCGKPPRNSYDQNQLKLIKINLVIMSKSLNLLKEQQRPARTRRGLGAATAGGIERLAQMISEGTLVTAANVHACIDGLVVVRTTEKYRRALAKSGVADPTAAAETGRVIKYHVEGTAEVLWSFGPARKAQPMAGYKLPGHLEVAQTPASSMHKPASADSVREVVRVWMM